MSRFVDIHSHLLPGIDDGPPDMAATVEMARAAVAAGTSVLAATPHLRPDFPDVDIQEIAGLGERVRQELAAAGVELEVVVGAEASLLWAIEASEEELGLATYGQRGQDLLVETPSDVSMLEQLLYQVRVRDVRVTLAHPERSAGFQGDPEKLVRLVDQGVLLQVNADALLSRRSSPARRLVERLCRDGLAHAVASDGHRAERWRSVDVLARAGEALRELVGEERTGWLLSGSPAAILAGRPLPELPPLELGRSGLLGRLFRGGARA